MNSETQQIELRWSTPQGRINPRFFRNQIGFALGAADPSLDWGWLFNARHTQPDGGGIAPIRFFTGANAKGAYAGIIAVGDDACGRLSANLSILLPIVRELDFIAGHPQIDFNRVWWKPANNPASFRLQTLVLTKLRGDQSLYDQHRADPTLTAPLIKEAVASGLTRMASRIGITDPRVDASDVEVIQVGPLGTQPVQKGGGEGLVSRLQNAIIKLPVQLHGDWRVGGLLTYGNGLITSVAAERHYRDDSFVPSAYPTMRLRDAA